MPERMNVPTDYPVTSETLPRPCPPVLGDRDEVAVAPKCVAVVGILVNRALEPFRPVRDARLAGHCGCLAGAGSHHRQLKNKRGRGNVRSLSPM